MNEQKRIDLSLLYVEDEAAARDEISVFLKRRVRDVVTAVNGAEGLERYCTVRPDVVVTDIRMPVMDGLRMAREIRAADRNALIIVTTAHSDQTFMLDAIDVGVDQYVLKPVRLDKLIAAVEKCAEITAFRRAEAAHRQEREQLIGQLQAALEKVKLLTGYLPICSSCKKIRNDRGYWQQIEEYIRDHSEAEFSHAICPDCAERLYPEYYKKKE